MTILPLLDDPEVVVRWNTCGLLHDVGDYRAVVPLVEKMKTDPDAQVRGTAAYALGGIGEASAIPALIESLEKDHEYDQLGHSPSSCASTALDDIIGAHETRIKVSNGLCTLPTTAPDLESLKTQAMEFFRSKTTTSGI